MKSETTNEQTETLNVGTFESSSTAENSSAFIQHNDLIEDIDIVGDPFYLRYYRSFHNHELDLHQINSYDESM